MHFVIEECQGTGHQLYVENCSQLAKKAFMTLISQLRLPTNPLNEVIKPTPRRHLQRVPIERQRAQNKLQTSRKCAVSSV